MKIVSFKEKESRFLITLTSSAFLVAETNVQLDLIPSVCLYPDVYLI